MQIIRVLIVNCLCFMVACGQQKQVELSTDYDSRIVRISKLEIHEEYLDEYLTFVGEVGRLSFEREEGVITLFSVQEKERPCHITILEIYRDRAAYEHHIATPHFQHYKQGTLHMVKDLQLIDGTALVPEMKIKEE